MAKSFVSEVACTGRIVHSDRIFPESLIERLGDRLMRIWEVFRQKSSSDEEIFINQSVIPQKFGEIRDRAYLDIHRNVR